METNMTPQRRKRILSLALILMIAGAALVLLFGSPLDLSRKNPPPVAQAFPVRAFANNTENETGNATVNQTIRDLQGQIAQLWNQLYAQNGLWNRMVAAETILGYIGYALVAITVVYLLGMFVLIRYMKMQMKALKEERIGPEDPNLYAILEPVIESVLGPQYGDLVVKRAKADVLRRIRQRAAERRIKAPGVAGRLQED